MLEIVVVAIIVFAGAVSAVEGTGGEAMEENIRFLFDLNGFVVLRGVLALEEVEAMNKAVDAKIGQAKERTSSVRNTGKDSALAGDGTRGRIDLGGLLGWEGELSEPFRRILAHPRLAVYLNALVGQGYRLDHSPLVIVQRQNVEGFSLHGGPVTQCGDPNPSLQYRYGNGKIINSLLAVSIQLSGQSSEHGGYCVVRGSHKMNFPVPLDMVEGRTNREHLFVPDTKPGDVILFSEATVHGAVPWTAETERRIALYRFAPATNAYGRAYVGWPKEYLEGMSAAQRCVMEPPYNAYLDRDYVDDDGIYVRNPRKEEKKAFDEQVFGTRYY